MTDSCQNQAISSDCIGTKVCVNESKRGTLRYFGDVFAVNGKWCGIELDESFGENDGVIDGKRYFMCKDKHGIFVPSSETRQLCEVDQSLSNSFSNNTVCVQKQSMKTDDSHFSFDLSNENSLIRRLNDFHSDNLRDLNQTFNVSFGKNGQSKSCETPVPGTKLHKEINQTLKSGFSPEKSTFVQLDLEKFRVLNKTIDLSTFKPNCMLKKNRFSQLDSEESLGIIPEILENSIELGTSSPVLNNKENYANEIDVISEVFFPSNQNCLDLKKQCLIDINIPLQSYSTNGRCTSTPKQLNNYSNLKYPMISQDKYNFLLQEGGKVEPIIAGSNQTAAQICFDEMEFDKDKILTSTSKLSLLPTQSPDLLSKTTVLDFKSNEISSVNNKNRNTQKTLGDAVEINECENFETNEKLHSANILNGTFEIKPAHSQDILSRNCLGASPVFPENCTTLNKTILKNAHEMLDDTIKNSNCGTSSQGNCTILLNCNSNSTISEITENQSQDVNSGKCPGTDRIGLCRMTFNSKNYISRRESINLPIKGSVSSFKTITENANLISDIDTFIKNGETQTEQSTSKCLNRRSRSAHPTLQKNDSLKRDTFRKPEPVSSNFNNLHRSKLRQSISRTKNVEVEIPKKSIKTPNTTYLPKPMKTNVYGEIKRPANLCKNSNIIDLKVKTVYPKKLKSNEKTLKNVPSQTKAVMKSSHNDTFIKNEITNCKFQKGNVKFDCKILNSNADVNMNLTFSASKSCKINTAVHNHEKFEPSSNSDKLQIELPVTSVKKTANEAILKHEVALQVEDVMKTSFDDCFVINGTSKQLNFKNGKINYNTVLNSPAEENHSKDKNRTFSASEIADVKNSKADDEIFSNYHNMDIEETSVDDCVTEINNEECLKSRVIQALPVMENISKHLSYQEEGIKSDTVLNSFVSLNSFAKDSNQTIYYDKENVTINKENTFEIPREMANKSVNDCTMLIKESPSGNSTMDIINSIEMKNDVVLEKKIDIPNVSRVESLKSVSEKSNLKYKNANSVSLKGLVKGIYSKAVKSRISPIPSHNYNISNNSSESKDPCTIKHIEDQGPSRISSNQNSRRIQIPKFSLKSSSGNSKEIARCQEKVLQKENLKSNSVSSEIKKTVQKSNQPGTSDKFCQRESDIKPIKVKATKVLSVGIPKKASSDTIKLKTDRISRIPFPGHRQVQASQSCIR